MILQLTKVLSIMTSVYEFIGALTENLHLFALPALDQNIGAAVFKILVKVLDILCFDWKSKILGCFTDGVCNMAKRFQEILTYNAEAVVSALIGL